MPESSILVYSPQEQPHGESEFDPTESLLNQQDIICHTDPNALILAQTMLDSVRPGIPPKQIESYALAHFLYKASLTVLGDSLATDKIVSPVAKERLRIFIDQIPEQLVKTDLIDHLVRDVEPYGGAGQMVLDHELIEHKARLDSIVSELDGRFRGELGDDYFGITTNLEAKQAYLEATRGENRRHGIRSKELTSKIATADTSHYRDSRGPLIADAMTFKTAELLIDQEERFGSYASISRSEGSKNHASGEHGEESDYDDLKNEASSIRDRFKQSLSDFHAGRISREDLIKVAEVASDVLNVLGDIFSDQTIPSSQDVAKEESRASGRTQNDAQKELGNLSSGKVNKEDQHGGHANSKLNTDEEIRKLLAEKLDTLYGKIDPEKEQPFQLNGNVRHVVAAGIAAAIKFIRKESNAEKNVAIADAAIEVALVAFEYKQLRKRLDRKSALGAMVLRRSIETLDIDSQGRDAKQEPVNSSY